MNILLGASSGSVLRLVIRRGLFLIAIGTVFGLGAALSLTRLMQSFLYGVTPTDPLTFGTVILTMVAVSLLACYLPARRALTIEPTVALRYE